MLMLSLLFLVVCLGFMCFYFIRKSTIFSVIGGGLWFLFVIYEYANNVANGGLWDIYRGFAILGTLLAVMSWIIPLTWRNNPVEEEPESEDYVESINRQRDEIITGARKSRRKEEF